MSDEETDSWPVALFVFLILITATFVAGDSLDTDKEVLLNLKAFFEGNNQINRGKYSQWNKQSNNPCEWPGINCSTTTRTARVTSINLSDNEISGKLFGNFSLLTELSFLDLSRNTLSGVIPEDLNRCRNLVHLNLSHNMLDGHLNLTGLNKLEKLDISVNRICGKVQLSLPTICDKLIVLNISGNNFTGVINGGFDTCQNLQFLDLSTNKLSGELRIGFERLLEFSASENNFNGTISSSMFGSNCNLQVLDLSENGFTGKIPAEMGSISSLQALYLGNNSFSNDIPDSLLNLNNLTFLDLSRNKFGGNIQEIFGKFTQIKFLVLHTNSYTGGIHTSGILKLPNISRLDLSFNKFSGPLPVEISELPSLKFLILAYNEFSGTIPSEYGNLSRLQALDLSFNRLNGSIPPTLGKLRSLLWLMLANNSLSGEIPPDLGNCTSLLWLNLANNQLSGKIPPQLTNIGTNASATFESNRRDNDPIVAGSGECLAMQRWIPANYPPFSFVYDILTRKSCRSIWDRILQGNGILPICAAGSSVRTFHISGYVQLSGNQLSGEVPPDIGKMQNFSMLHLGFNEFFGKLPSQIGEMPLVNLNISNNKFSGEIPGEIGNIKCLQNLDLSCNNFSGMFPASFNNLSELNKFNISYNPLIYGVIPITGQFLTFEKSYLGDPHLEFPNFIDNTTDKSPHSNNHDGKTNRGSFAAFLVFLALTLIFLIFGVLSLIVCMMVKSPSESPGYLLQDIKYRHDLASSSSYSSPWLSDTIKVIRLDKTAFTHADILKATGNFSEERIIGKGGFGTVYRGVLPDGREVAVKKLQREGIEGEREFRAEMEVLSGNGFGWPHPNLVTLYGWCLDGTQKILVYEYMEGGSLEDLISDRIKLTWRRRIDVALDVARALMFLHHECYPAIVHRDVKASNVLLDKDGKARVTDFGLARVVDAGDSHVSTVVAGTIGYVAPEYGQTWHATTKGDVYSFGVLTMELATGRRALDGGEECLVEWAKRVMGNGRQGLSRSVIPVVLLGSGLAEGAEEMSELLRVGVKCTAESPQARPNMKEVLAMLIKISCIRGEFNYDHSPPL
nr:putative lrr receptor-like serine/threonine-protein kinase [Quercus suber]